MRGRIIGSASSNIVPEKIVALPARPRLTDALMVEIHDRIVCAISLELTGADMETATRLSRLDAAVMRILHEATQRR